MKMRRITKASINNDNQRKVSARVHRVCCTRADRSKALVRRLNLNRNKNVDVKKISCVLYHHVVLFHLAIAVFVVIVVVAGAGFVGVVGADVFVVAFLLHSGTMLNSVCVCVCI